MIIGTKKIDVVKNIVDRQESLGIEYVPSTQKQKL